MGQCMSRKAAGAFAASAATAHSRPTAMHKKLHENSEDAKPTKKPTMPCTKGVAISFGFKKQQPPTAPSVIHNRNVGRRLAGAEIIDRNGNEDTYQLTRNAFPSGRTTPRLPAPKKEGNAVRVSRFGFRQPSANRFNKVTDVNAPAPRHIEYGNNNLEEDVKRDNTTRDTQKPVKLSSITQPEIGRFTLQSSQLPTPQFPERVIETKTAKTLANNNRKYYGKFQQQTDTDSSSKDGSMTEDSGVGSHTSGNSVSNIKLLQNSPQPVRKYYKPRNLEVVITGNKFDVRDLDDSTESSVPLPPLPTTFLSNHRTDFVHGRISAYHRQIENIQSRLSITSSEGCYSDEFPEEEKIFNSKFVNDRNSSNKLFLKPKAVMKHNSATSSSADEHEWAAGEAMAEEISFSFSSSDESKGLSRTDDLNTEAILQNLMISTVRSLVPKNDVQKVLLTIEDPQFAAVAEASNCGTLLEDETSPTDSLMCYSESDEFIKSKSNGSPSSNNSKDINEKLTLSPSSPCSPTDASNSLSLSDGRDFFVDDEIADQPALVFDDTLTGQSEAVNNISESTSTVIDSARKSFVKKSFRAFEDSPRSIRSRKFLLGNQTGSVDTLSPCESITSDDLMLDFEYSQSSGLDEVGDRTCDDSSKGDLTVKRAASLRDWPCPADSTSSRIMRASRLLTSRARTPSSIPDSPRSLDSRINVRPRPLTHSPLRQSRGSGSVGYESDDSIKFEKSNNIAISQDIMSIKTMLLKLKRVLLESDEEKLLRSETHNPFDTQNFLRNGLFNGRSLDGGVEDINNVEDIVNTKMQLADLKRQVLFLQGQLEDKEKTVQNLQNEIVKFVSVNETACSAPASVSSETPTSNAATQTERIRPVSAGPSLFQDTIVNERAGALVSVNETPPRRSLPSPHIDSPLTSSSSESKRVTSRLWRRPGEPPSPQRYSPTTSSSIPRRTNSRTRGPSTPS